MSSTHQDFLKNTTIGEACPEDHGLVFALPTTTVGQATKLMNEKNITSLPIWDPVNRHWIGVVDMFSLMTFVAFGRVTREREESDSIFSKFHYTEVEIGPLRLVNRTGKTMSFYPPSQNLLTALEKLAFSSYRLFLEPKKGLFDFENPKCSIFSQSDAIRFLAKNLDKLGKIGDTFIQELGMVDETPVTMSEDETALNGFRTIRLMAVNAVAVVDDKGSIVANLSSTDVRGMKSEELCLVRKPVLEYLKARNPTGKLVHPVTCTPRALLKDVILQLSTAKIHRVWVVDSAMKPVGVVTLSDICRVLVV